MIIDAFAANGPTETVTTSLSFVDLLFSSSPIVMGVLLLLVAFSFFSWAIIYSKWKMVNRSRAATEQFLEVFWGGKSMDFIYSESKKFPHSPISRLFQAGYKELQKIVDKERQKHEKKETPLAPASAIENVERALTMSHRIESLKLDNSMTFLATAASTAPFIGLFGTVWGIMNSFQNIGAQGGASLATVAPGIAEALIATAVGLACAIPATMGYNYFNHKIRSIRADMDVFGSDFLNIVKRNFLAN